MQNSVFTQKMNSWISNLVKPAKRKDKPVKADAANSKNTPRISKDVVPNTQPKSDLRAPLESLQNSFALEQKLQALTAEDASDVPKSMFKTNSIDGKNGLVKFCDSPADMSGSLTGSFAGGSSRSQSIASKHSATDAYMSQDNAYKSASIGGGTSDSLASSSSEIVRNSTKNRRDKSSNAANLPGAPTSHYKYSKIASTPDYGNSSVHANPIVRMGAQEGRKSRLDSVVVYVSQDGSHPESTENERVSSETVATMPQSRVSSISSQNRQPDGVDPYSLQLSNSRAGRKLFREISNGQSIKDHAHGSNGSNNLFSTESNNLSSGDSMVVQNPMVRESNCKYQMFYDLSCLKYHILTNFLSL